MLRVEQVTVQVGNVTIQYDRCMDDDGESFTANAQFQVAPQGPVTQGDDDDSDTSA